MALKRGDTALRSDGRYVWANSNWMRDTSYARNAINKLAASCRRRGKTPPKITPEEYVALLDAQGLTFRDLVNTSGCRGKNADGYCLDHDNKTGEVRGFIRHAANRIIGSTKEDSIEGVYKLMDEAYEARKIARKTLSRRGRPRTSARRR